MNKSIFLATVSAFTLSICPLRADTNAPGAVPASPSSVVARVNGTDITRAQLDESLQEITDSLTRRGQPIPTEKRKELETQVLDQVIAQQLVLEKSKTVKLDSVDTKVAAQFNELKARFPDEKSYADQLKSMNMTEEKLKEKIAEGIRMEALIDQDVKSKIQIGPTEAKEFYESHADLFKRPAEIRASHILVMLPKGADEKVTAEKKAVIDKARERVVKGEDFAKVASEVSEDGSKAKGGDLGYFGQGQMVKPFEEAAFALKSNEVSQVVTTQFGYHVIKQTGSHPAGTASLDEEKPKIEQYLTQQKLRQAMLDYVAGLRKEAKVEVLLK